jgi:hypothetical protein
MKKGGEKKTVCQETWDSNQAIFSVNSIISLQILILIFWNF